MVNPVDRIAEALERIAAAMEREAEAAGRPVPEALSKEDAAWFLGVDGATIDHLVRTRKLAYVQHGTQRGRVFPLAALRQFLVTYRRSTVGELVDQRKKA